jgi:transposase
MPPCTVSADLKARIPVLCQRGHTVKHICNLLGVKKTLIYKVLHLFPSASNHVYSNQGRCRSLTIDDIAFITAILCHRPTIYLDELRYELHSRRGVFVSLQTLLRTFQRLHINRKCISAYALERNEDQRAIYMNNIAEVAPDPEMLMFGDEAAKDERTLIRRHGRSRIGTRCVNLFFLRLACNNCNCFTVI